MCLCEVEYGLHETRPQRKTQDSKLMWFADADDLRAYYGRRSRAIVTLRYARAFAAYVIEVHSGQATTSNGAVET